MNSFSNFFILSKPKIPSIVLGIFGFMLLLISQFQTQSIARTDRKLIAPPPMIERFAFGQKEILADVLWIRTLQDFDYCDQSIAKQVCQNNSWLFKMLDTVTNLSPKFRIPYAAGGLALTVIITDIDGATKIFDKGVAALPHDWTISYRAAYHYLYEVKDKKRAAELLTQSAKSGGAPWFLTLAGRLYSDSGELDLAQNLLQEMKDTNQDTTLIKRLQDKIDSMKASKSLLESINK